MTRIEQFHGAAAADGAELTAVYAEQPDAGVAFALLFHADELPRFVHWGRPLSDARTVVNAYDALRPQRVSGSLDFTPWQHPADPGRILDRSPPPGSAPRRRGAVLQVHRHRH